MSSHESKNESVHAIRAMQVVAQEQAAAAAAASVKQQARKQRQVTKVLEASKLRSERAARVSKLKVGVLHVVKPALVLCTLTDD